MAFPSVTTTHDADASAAFVSAAQAAGLNIGGLNAIAQLQLVLANTFANLAPSAQVPAANVQPGTFATGAFVFPGALTVAGTLTPQVLVDISGASAGQVKFPAAQNPSSNANTLDDYEEGVWTPVYQLAGGSVTYSTQTGSYTKVGRLVTVQFRVVVATVSTPSGSLEITGLPFAASALQKGAMALFGDIFEVALVTPLQGVVETGVAVMYVGTFVAGGFVDIGDKLKAGTTLAGMVSYEV